MQAGKDKGYKDMRWISDSQLQNATDEKGEKIYVKKGEKGVKVEYWDYQETVYKKDKDGRELTETRTDKKTGKTYQARIPETFIDENGVERVKKINRVGGPKISSYTVFNIEQLKGIPKDICANPPLPVHDMDEDIPELYSIRENAQIKSEIAIFEDAQEKSFYDRDKDEIHLRPMESYNSKAEFYADMMKNISHATGKENRLNRYSLEKTKPGHDSKEALTAELSAVFTQAKYGVALSPEDENNAVDEYGKKWATMIREDANKLFAAAYAADRANSEMGRKMSDREEVKAIKKERESVNKVADKAVKKSKEQGKTKTSTKKRSLTVKAMLYRDMKKEKTVEKAKEQSNKENIHGQDILFKNKDLSDEQKVQLWNTAIDRVKKAGNSILDEAHILGSGSYKGESYNYHNENCAHWVMGMYNTLDEAFRLTKERYLSDKEYKTILKEVEQLSNEKATGKVKEKTKSVKRKLAIAPKNTKDRDRDKGR